MPAKFVNQGLWHVLYRRQATGHVSVKGRVSDRSLALVGRGQNQPAPAVRERHHQIAPDPGLEVLCGEAAGVFAVQPKGNYVFIKGNQADPNADFLHEGQLEVLKGLRCDLVQGYWLGYPMSQSEMQLMLRSLRSPAEARA